jgi:uncharacterized protein YdaU (DUF1376 family)
MHYYSFNIADWHLGTSHLSLEEEAVYFKLINHYYDTEKPIPKETQQVIRRLRLGNHEVIVGLILNEFFVLKDNGWHHVRCDKEIEDYHNKAETSRENGKKGGRPRKNKDLQDNPIGFTEEPEITQEVILANPSITQEKANQEPRTKNQSISFDAKSGVFKNVGESQIEVWKKAFPAVNLDIEMAKAVSWLIANPTKKKSNYSRFLNGWFTRCQDSGGTKQSKIVEEYNPFKGAI